jgi:hypothetical protein
LKEIRGSSTDSSKISLKITLNNIQGREHRKRSKLKMEITKLNKNAIIRFNKTTSNIKTRE